MFGLTIFEILVLCGVGILIWNQSIQLKLLSEIEWSINKHELNDDGDL